MPLSTPASPSSPGLEAVPPARFSTVVEMNSCTSTELAGILEDRCMRCACFNAVFVLKSCASIQFATAGMHAVTPLRALCIDKSAKPITQTSQRLWLRRWRPDRFEFDDDEALTASINEALGACHDADLTVITGAAGGEGETGC